jgi:hypothetical protein
MKEAKMAPPNSKRPYYVYDPGVKDTLGTAKVSEDDQGRKIVNFSREEAKYFLEQMAIGVKPVEELADKTRNALHQMSGGRVEPGSKSVKSKAHEEPAQEMQVEPPTSKKTFRG